MMTNERAKQILASFGGKPEQWPEDERLCLQQLLLSNTELRIIQQQELQLDEQIVKMFSDIKDTDTHYLQKTILASLPHKEIPASSKTIKFYFDLINRKIYNLLDPVWVVATVSIVMLLTVSLNDMPSTLNTSSMEDELLLMAETLDNSEELELLAVLEPELFEDTSDMM